MSHPGTPGSSGSCHNVGVRESLGVYIHIPFCRSICSFCTFATASRSRDAETAYLRALGREIVGSRPLGKDGRFPVDSVYFGGGTPSVLSADDVQAVMDAIRWRFDVARDSEISLEVDPGTADRQTLAGYREMGVNRLSVGGQSLANEVLHAIGRRHGTAEIYQTFDDARRVGFNNINLDLMVGLPGEDVDNDLAGLSHLAPQHASVYILDVSEKLPQGREVRLGNHPLPDEVHTLDSYRRARDELVRLGLRHYEISNFALPGKESRHNLKYWSDESYLGFGASAHSYLDGVRFWNVKSPARYVERMDSEGQAVEETEPFDADQRAAEHLYTGLRCVDGVSLEAVETRYGVSVMERYGEELSTFIELGLVQVSGGTMKLTEDGFMISNEIFQVFV
jgi:oxygen-independent coproporphyrinogen-3 oxidase